MQVLSSWDDGTIEDLRIAELMSKYKIKTIFYWPAYPKVCNEPKGRQSLNAEQRKEIAKDHEIGSHTLTHPLLTRIPLDRAIIEISNSKLMLEKELGKDVKKFSYPRGYTNTDLQQAVKNAGYESARGVQIGNIHPSENQYHTHPTVHVGYKRHEYGDMSWLEYAKALLEVAVRTEGSVYELFGHSWEVSKYDGWHDLEQLLKEIP